MMTKTMTAMNKAQGHLKERDGLRPSRPLTDAEWDALSPGLANALRAEAVIPRIVPRAHPAAIIAGLWRGGTPILTRGAAIWWPGARACFARHPAMAILQHELQHVLEYAAGQLTALGYLTHPRNWIYAWRPGAPWGAYGAEQRASMVEDLWRMEHGLADARGLPALRQVIPWAETLGTGGGLSRWESRRAGEDRS